MYDDGERKYRELQIYYLWFNIPNNNTTAPYISASLLLVGVLAAGLATATSWRLLSLSAASSFTGSSTLCTDRRYGEFTLKIGVDTSVLIAEGVLQVILTLAGVAIISNYRATIVFYLFRSPCL